MAGPRFVVGLVGGIGSGKSFVASLLARMAGARVIDADRIVGRLLAEPAVLRKLRRIWGPDAFRKNGSLDRRAASRRVFRDRAERRKLERLLHPRVRAEILRRLGRIRRGLVVLDAPLTLETGLERVCDAILFVDAPERVRLERVRRARGWDGAELRRRERNQTSLRRKRRLADAVVPNRGDVRETRAALRRFLRQGPIQT